MSAAARSVSLSSSYVPVILEDGVPISDTKVSDGMLLERVNHALQLARLAVDNDTKGNYEAAVLHYKETITILETSVISAPEENQQEMFDLVHKFLFLLHFKLGAAI
jgi:hypothetical protein